AGGGAFVQRNGAADPPCFGCAARYERQATDRDRCGGGVVLMQCLQQPVEIAQWLHERVTGDLLCDSRQLRAGDGFIAWPGAATDGRRFVTAALAAGAAVAVVEQAG